MGTWWILLDGFFGLLNSVVAVRMVYRQVWQADPELQAYLIHKERDGTVDPSMETKMQTPTPNLGLSCGTCVMLVLGIVLYANSSGEGCDELPEFYLFYLLLFRIFFPIVFGC